MTLADIFSSSLATNAKRISRDSRIYEAFKPYLSDILGLSLEDFMNSRELRQSYQQKYTAIKNKFQAEQRNNYPIKDEVCFAQIADYGKAWQEFIQTARETTLDEGQSIIQSTPLDSYILMTPQQRQGLEQKLIRSAIERVRTITAESENNYQTENVAVSDPNELNAIIEDHTDTINVKQQHRI